MKPQALLVILTSNLDVKILYLLVVKACLLGHNDRFKS